jgi:hypothetical protein
VIIFALAVGGLPACGRHTTGIAVPVFGDTREPAYPWTIPTEPWKGEGPAARTFYVDGAHGDDRNDGRSQKAPFRTLGRAVAESGAPVEAGDRVLVKAGLYRERLALTKHGVPGRPIVVSTFGDGEVIVDASAPVIGWTRAAGEVYRAHVGFVPVAVVVDGQPLFPEPAASALDPGRWHYDAGSGDLWVRCPRGGNPEGREVGVVKDDEYQDGVSLHDASDVVLFGLTVRFAGGNGLAVLGDRVRVERCRALFNGKAGISVYPYGATASTDVALVRNELYQNVLRNWPRGRYKDGGWAMGAVSHGTPHVRFEGNVSHRNGGEGLGAYGGAGGSTFRDNVSFDNWSVNLYVDNQPHATVERNLVYCHDPDPADLYGNGDPDPGDGHNVRRLRPIGVMTADEKYGTSPPANLRDVRIVNNLILNCRRGLDHYAQAEGSGLKEVRILHNTIVVPEGDGPDEAFVGIRVPYNGGQNAGTTYRDNLVYASHKGTRLLWGDPPRAGDRFAGLAFDHNLWFHSADPRPFHWGSGSREDFSHDEWAALGGTAHADGDQTGDPRLRNARAFEPNDLSPADGSSPAVDHGGDSGVTEDFGRASRPAGAGFDIGAFELRAPGP